MFSLVSLALQLAPSFPQLVPYSASMWHGLHCPHYCLPPIDSLPFLFQTITPAYKHTHKHIHLCSCKLSHTLLIWGLCIRENMALSFKAWLISFNMMAFCCIICLQIPWFPFASGLHKIPLCVCAPHFLYALVDGHLVWLHRLTITNNPTINTSAHISKSVDVQTFKDVSWSGTARF